MCVNSVLCNIRGAVRRLCDWLRGIWCCSNIEKVKLAGTRLKLVQMSSVTCKLYNNNPVVESSQGLEGWCVDQLAQVAQYGLCLHLQGFPQTWRGSPASHPWLLWQAGQT